MAYTVDTDNIRYYANDGTGVWIGTVGEVTAPTDLTTDPVGADPVGWLSEDGVTRDIEKDISELRALQGGAIVKRRVTKTSQVWKFQCLEETALVVGLANGGNDITLTAVGSGIAKIDISKNQNRTIEKSVVIDAVGDDVWERTYLSEADITFQGSIPVSHPEDPRIYEFEVTLSPGKEAFILTNSPSVVADALPPTP